LRNNLIASQTLGAAQDGYQLTWSNTDGYWKANPDVDTPLAGDVTGPETATVVAKIKGNPVATQTLGASQDGYVLTWSQTDGYWYAKVATGGGGSFTAGGDLSGSSSSQTVIKINGTSVPAAPSANQMLVATSSTASIWSQIYDGYVSASAAIAGTKISPNFGSQGITTTGSFSSGAATTTSLTTSLLNVSGKEIFTAISSPSVSNAGEGIIYFDSTRNKFLVSENAGAYGIIGVDGYFGSTNISTTGALNVGSAVTTSLATSIATISGKLIMPGIPTSSVLSNTSEGIIYFDSTLNKFRMSQNGSSYVNIITDGYTAGGDLSGTYANPMVAKIKGNSVATQTLGASQDGYVLTWSNTDGYWYAKASAGGGATGAAGGDLTGTYPNPTVISMTNTGTTVASTTTGKFITNVGRRVKTTVTTTNLTVVDGYEIIIVGTLIAGITVTLPASPTAGDIYTIKDQGGTSATFNIIVSGNGNNIDGSSSYTLNSSYQSITVVFANSSWSIL
jgi:hypothetical protein